MSLPNRQQVRSAAEIAAAVRKRLISADILTLDAITAAVIDELREEYIFVVKSR